jgi:subtilisin family serine protease
VGPSKQEAILSAVSSRVKYFRRPAQNNLRPQIQPGGQGNPPASVFDRLALVKLDKRATLETAMEQFQRNPAVLYVEPNYRFHISRQSAAQIIPDDFEFPRMWGLNNTGQTNGKENADIDAPEAWTLTTGDKRVKVAVIDTGVDYYHPDLAENIWLNQGEIPGNGIDDDGNGYVDDVHGYDFVSDDSDPMDDNNHGTHVAGIIGAVGNNKIGVAGVCWQVSLMAVKAFDENGMGDTDQIIEAIRYSVANGANVINASWGMFYDHFRLGLARVKNDLRMALDRAKLCELIGADMMFMTLPVMEQTYLAWASEHPYPDVPSAATPTTAGPATPPSENPQPST